MLQSWCLPILHEAAQSTSSPGCSTESMVFSSLFYFAALTQRSPDLPGIPPEAPSSNTFSPATFVTCASLCMSTNKEARTFFSWLPTGHSAHLMAPRTVSLPLSLRVRLSVGSPSFLMSHQSTLPSVDTDMHSVPVLDCSQAKSYTGSLQSTKMPSAHEML